MSAVACSPAFDDDNENENDGTVDERIDRMVRFGRYASETRDHLLRMCELIANGDEAFRADLRLVVEVLWV